MLQAVMFWRSLDHLKLKAWAGGLHCMQDKNKLNGQSGESAGKNDQFLKK